MSRLNPIIFVLALAIAGFSMVTMPAGMSQDQSIIFAIMLVTLSLWGTGLVPGYVASTFLFVALILTGLAVPQDVFASFSSSAIWLIVAGAVIGAAITHSGLGTRIGVFARPHLSKSYPALIAGLMLLGMALGFLMPSSLGRAAVLVPVGLALADALGLEKGSLGRTGVAVVIAIGTNMPSFAILPSNIPNVILAGVAEQSLGVHLGYTEYLLLHYPILGVLKSAIIVALVVAFFPARLSDNSVAPVKASGSKGQQAALFVVLLITLGFWSTDQIHGINAAWVGLTAALVLMVPQLGFITPPTFKSSVDFSIILFVAGALTLGTVVNSSGLGDIIAHAVIQVLPFRAGSDFLNFMSLSVLGIGTSVFTTVPGMPAVITPLTPELAQATGFSLKTVLMTQVIGFSTILFPYQIAPLIVTMGLAGESTRPLLKVILSIFVISLLVLLPLDFLWWKVLGKI